MATRISQLLVSRLKPALLGTQGSRSSVQLTARRTVVYTTSGALHPEPSVTRFGIARVLLMVFPFLYIGATLGKEGAAFMEENDIFVPDDDDDD